jgi:hypothetical protein
VPAVAGAARVPAAGTAGIALLLGLRRVHSAELDNGEQTQKPQRAEAFSRGRRNTVG